VSCMVLIYQMGSPNGGVLRTDWPEVRAEHSPHNEGPCQLLLVDHITSQQRPTARVGLVSIFRVPVAMAEGEAGNGFDGTVCVSL
jgi:hypothetical protein